MAGQPSTQREAARYSEERKVATLRWAILDHLKSLPDLSSGVLDKGFHQVIRRHFFVKREEIKLQVVRFKEEAQHYRSQFESLEAELFSRLDALRL
jgi:hypothetical protein